MIDSKSTFQTPEPDLDAQPVRFDAIASANAKPVEPIPTGPVAEWGRRVRRAGQMVNVRTKALALVLVGGLAIGTLGGTILVKQSSSPLDAVPANQEPAADTTAAQATDAGAGLSDTAKAALDVQASALALQSGERSSRSRVRHRRIRPPAEGAQRAYRVAVIK